MYGGEVDKHDGFFDYGTIVDYETAVRVSKLGLPWQKSLYRGLGYHYYNSKGELDGDATDEIKAVCMGNLSRDQRKSMLHISAPSYGNLVVFFHRNGFFVSIVPEVYDDGTNWLWQIVDIRSGTHENLSTGMYGDNGEYPEFKFALKSAINKLMDIFESHGWFQEDPEIERTLDRIEERICQEKSKG